MQSPLAIHVISKRTVQGVNIVVGEYVLQIVLLEHRVSRTPTVGLENVYSYSDCFQYHLIVLSITSACRHCSFAARKHRAQVGEVVAQTSTRPPLALISISAGTA